MNELLKQSKIFFLPDERLSRDRAQIVARTILRLRNAVPVDMQGSGKLSEDEVIQKVRQSRANIILIPWHKALEWTKLDGQLGAQRLRGPVVLGYMGEPVAPDQIEIPPHRTRLSVVDLHRSPAEETIPWILALAQDEFRGGSAAIHQFALPPSAIPTHWEDLWQPGESIGSWLDRLNQHPEFNTHGWTGRLNQFRHAAIALWTLIHEEGPGTGELAQAQATAARSALAQVQLAVAPQFVTLRMAWEQPGWNSRDLLEAYWRRPNDMAPDTIAILTQNSDYCRIQHHAETSKIELILGWTPSAPSIIAPNELRTLMIEPLESRFAAEGRACTITTPIRPWPKKGLEPSSSETSGNTITPNADKSPNDQLLKLIQEKDRVIERMKQGGVGENTTPVMKAPDLESLIGAVRDRIEDSLVQIRDLSRAIKEAKLRGTKPEDSLRMKQRLRSLQLRHKTWMTELSEIMKRFDHSVIDEPIEGGEKVA